MQARRFAAIVFSAVIASLLVFSSPTSLFHFAFESSGSSYNFSYTVQAGDTLSLIGSNFGVSWQDIANFNGIAPPYLIYVGESLSIPLSSPTVNYVVQSGDTLNLIASIYEINWQNIALANNLAPPYLIYAGESLAIPLVSQIVYTVQSGDSLYEIGLKFSIPWQSIASSNQIQPPYVIYVGESLVIPLQATNSPPPPPPNHSWVWLWNNYTSGLSEIVQNPGAVSVVSPNTYYLFDDGTFGSVSQDICGQVRAIGLQCDPLIQNDQNNPAGINTLLTNPYLQSNFIQLAVQTAESTGLDGYNVDFEPSAGTWNLASQYGTFLTNFADAMHSIGKQLSVDVAQWDQGALWNYGIEGSSSVDLVVTIGTYDQSFTVFTQQLQAMVSSIPLSKIAIGLLTVQDDGTLQQRIQAIEAAGITTVMVWPSYPGFLTSDYWTTLSQFVSS